jgi:hypothetical protein
MTSTEPTFLDAIKANQLTMASYAVTAIGIAGSYALGPDDPAILQNAAQGLFTTGAIYLGFTRGGKSTYDTMQRLHEYRNEYGGESVVRHALPLMTRDPCSKAGAAAQLKKEGLEDLVKDIHSSTD